MRYDYRRAEDLNHRLSDQVYVTDWNTEARELFNDIINNCRMCCRCRKCKKDNAPYRSLFLSAFEGAKKVSTGEMTTNEWLSKNISALRCAHDDCPTYFERLKQRTRLDSISDLEDNIIDGELDGLSDEEFNRILIDIATE